MQSGNTPTTLRRSSRIPTAVSILVTSLDGTHFSEVCETLVVNAHGCAMLSPARLEAGVPLHFHSKEGREATARVVYCQPYGSDNRSWRLGASLDQPENFWGLRNIPKDWAVPSVPVPPRVLQTLTPVPAPAAPAEVTQISHSSDAALGRLARQLEAPLKRMIAETIRPLQAEVAALSEKLAHREANPSRFEVSLSSIPPDLEQQLELRLRRDLSPRVLDEARQQSAQLLNAAKATLDQRTNESCERVLRRGADEIQAVERRAQEISAHVSEDAREQLNRGLGDFHQRLLDGGNSLKRLSEELLEFLQHNLNAEYDARRGDLEQLRASVSAEALRLQEQVEFLDSRIAKLDESARGLESGLDQRLSQMSSNTVRETRTHLDGLANDILENLTARSAKKLGDQQDEASENMKIVQKGIVTSASESLKQQSANSLQAYERSMDELARLSIERCRMKLANGFTALVKNLGEQFGLRDEAGDDRVEPQLPRKS